MLNRLKKQILKTLVVSITLSFSQNVLANSDLLQSGPMVGYSEMREVLLWVQTKKEANVKIAYWEKGNPKYKKFTDQKITLKTFAFTTKLIADDIEPGKKYEYEVYINDKLIKREYPLEFESQTLWQWRTNPPNFKVALGSCTYISEKKYDRKSKNPYGGDYQIFNSIYQKNPNLMLWLGDNTYLREADWFTKTGINHRYTHTRSNKEMQPLLGSVHNYALWDDHDFGPNDSDRSFRDKDKALNSFRMFWGNPSFGQENLKGTFTKFQWSDVEFFFLDNRYYRSPINRKFGEKTILGKEQIEWLTDSLVSSKANFKIVAMGGQLINPVAKFENYAVYSEERQQLINIIEKEEIEGVIFLSGDRHHTELSVLKRDTAYPLYDFTVSPLTSGSHNSKDENNYLREKGTYLAKRNFATMSFSGKGNDRTLLFEVFDKNGKLVWDKKITAKDLKINQ